MTAKTPIDDITLRVILSYPVPKTDTKILYVDVQRVPIIVVGVYGGKKPEDKINVTELALGAGASKDTLTLILESCKALFDLKSEICLVNSCDIEVHRQIYKSFPDIVIKVPVFWVFDTLVRRLKLDVNDAGKLTDWFKQEGVYERVGTVPSDLVMSPEARAACNAAQELRRHWTYFGFYTAGRKDMWKLLWGSTPHYNFQIKWDAALRNGATWQRAAINFYCSSLEVNGPQDDPDTADAAPELVKGMKCSCRKEAGHRMECDACCRRAWDNLGEMWEKDDFKIIQPPSIRDDRIRPRFVEMLDGFAGKNKQGPKIRLKTDQHHRPNTTGNMPSELVPVGHFIRQIIPPTPTDFNRDSHRAMVQYEALTVPDDYALECFNSDSSTSDGYLDCMVENQLLLVDTDWSSTSAVHERLAHRWSLSVPRVTIDGGEKAVQLDFMDWIDSALFPRLASFRRPVPEDSSHAMTIWQQSSHVSRVTHRLARMPSHMVIQLDEPTNQIPEEIALNHPSSRAYEPGMKTVRFTLRSILVAINGEHLEAWRIGVETLRLLSTGYGPKGNVARAVDDGVGYVRIKQGSVKEAGYVMNEEDDESENGE